jgi:hypothetical protein
MKTDIVARKLIEMTLVIVVAQTLKAVLKNLPEFSEVSNL